MKLFWKYLTEDKWFFKSISPLSLIIILAGGFFRLYKLNWGDGYFFHPDEYHIAAAVNRLDFPTKMDPELFSYGSFTVYLIFFTKEILRQFSFVFALTKNQVQAMSPILVGRFYSAIFSTLTILLTYFISKKIFKRRIYQYSTMFLVATTAGLIQQAHFATPESILTFFLLLTLLLFIKWVDKNDSKTFLFSAISLGLALGTKITALTFLPLLLFLPLIKINFRNILKRNYESLFKPISLIIISGLTVFITFFIVFPYSILDWKGFMHSMNYETSVGRGSQVVFYTRQFIDTKPIIFQVEKILIYALGPTILIFAILGLFLLIKKVFEKGFFYKQVNLYFVLFALAFSLYFFPNSYLFAKWTRFIAPAFPFFSIFAVYSIKNLVNFIPNTNRRNITLYSLTLFLSIVSFIWGLAFFAIYLKPDVRISSTKWVEKNIPKESLILTESGNMLEVPLGKKVNTYAFDFYHLDENKKLQDMLPNMLFRADYFIIQSRRIFTNHQRFPDKFPITSNFYDLLFAEQLGFEKIAEFNSYPSTRAFLPMSELTITDEASEETWTVFDHPVVRIYKKTTPFSINMYERLIKI